MIKIRKQQLEKMQEHLDAELYAKHEEQVLSHAAPLNLALTSKEIADRFCRACPRARLVGYKSDIQLLLFAFLDLVHGENFEQASPYKEIMLESSDRDTSISSLIDCATLQMVGR